jgi:hypothetical protein
MINTSMGFGMKSIEPWPHKNVIGYKKIVYIVTKEDSKPLHMSHNLRYTQGFHGSSTF